MMKLIFLAFMAVAAAVSTFAFYMDAADDEAWDNFKSANECQLFASPFIAPGFIARSQKVSRQYKCKDGVIYTHRGYAP